MDFALSHVCALQKFETIYFGDVASLFLLTSPPPLVTLCHLFPQPPSLSWVGDILFACPLIIMFNYLRFDRFELFMRVCLIVPYIVSCPLK